MQVSTIPSFDTSVYEIVGIVDAVNTQAVSLLREKFASLTGIFGGENAILNKKFIDAREGALNQLKQKAKEMGAEMIVGVVLSSETITFGETEFISHGAVGTAIRKKGAMPEQEAGRRRKSRKTLRH